MKASGNSFKKESQKGCYYILLKSLQIHVRFLNLNLSSDHKLFWHIARYINVRPTQLQYSNTATDKNITRQACLKLIQDNSLLVQLFVCFFHDKQFVILCLESYLGRIKQRHYYQGISYHKTMVRNVHWSLKLDATFSVYFVLSMLLLSDKYFPNPELIWSDKTPAHTTA